MKCLHCQSTPDSRNVIDFCSLFIPWIDFFRILSFAISSYRWIKDNPCFLCSKLHGKSKVIRASDTTDLATRIVFLTYLSWWMKFNLNFFGSLIFPSKKKMAVSSDELKEILHQQQEQSQVNLITALTQQIQI